jgi:uncharacterized peroxidase-related enzyme
MPRIQPVNSTNAPRESATQLEGVNKMFGGWTPNMFATVAQSPSSLSAMLAMFANTGKSSFGAKTGELLAIAVAQSNACTYCLSAHTAIGTSLKVDPAALASARQGESTDPRIRAALKLTISINESRGHISDATLAEARAAGLTDAEIVEIVAHVALNVFTNYLNSVAETTIDFPEVSLSAAA